MYEKKVSFIIPVLNEEQTIKQCLDSIINIDYPMDKKEILLALGLSKDHTTELIYQYRLKHEGLIKTFNNTSGNTAVGRNICVNNSTGEYLFNFSGHAVADRNLLKILVDKLGNSNKNIVSVGCANISPGNQNLVGRVSSIVFSSFIGGKNFFVQNASYDSECFADHISFALYRKQPVLDVGCFDENFWCGQDAELDMRLLKKGYKILYTPETKVDHFKRSSIKDLFKQMYRYGVARAKMIRKHRRGFKPVYLVGTLFVFGIVFLLLSNLLGFLPFALTVFLMVGYIGVCLLNVVMKTKKILHILLSPIIAFVIHTGYGIGFIRGLI